MIRVLLIIILLTNSAFADRQMRAISNEDSFLKDQVGKIGGHAEDEKQFMFDKDQADAFAAQNGEEGVYDDNSFKAKVEEAKSRGLSQNYEDAEGSDVALHLNLMKGQDMLKKSQDTIAYHDDITDATRDAYKNKDKIFSDNIADCRDQAQAQTAGTYKVIKKKRKRDVEIVGERPCEDPVKFTCTSNLIVRCDQPVTHTNAPSNLSSNLPINYSGGGMFYLGSTNPHWLDGGRGRVFEYNMRFNVADSSNIKEFMLQEIRFDDWILVTLNGSKIYSGPHSFSKLEMKHTAFWGYHRVDIGDGRDHSTENGTWYQRSPNLNLKPYLRSGSNDLKIRLIVGDKGGLFMNFKFGQYGCNKWSESWQHSCAPNLRCPNGENILEDRCISSGDRWISGVRVNRACWSRQQSKTCRVNLNPCDCTKYDAEHNCIFNDLSCTENDSSGLCIKERKRYGCLENTQIEEEYEETIFNPDSKDASHHAVCDALCMKGDCIDTASVENTDFGRALASLQMASEMSKDVKLKGEEFAVDVFKGEGLHCSKKGFGWHDCCRDADKGWGKSLGSSCTPEERKLKDLKNDGRCIKVGQTKSKDGVGFVKKDYYCCYENKLSRILAEKLKTDLWVDNAPNCKGFNREELEKINFDQVDLSEFYEDIRKKAEDVRNKYNDKYMQGKVQASKLPDSKDGKGGINMEAMKLPSLERADQATQDRWKEKRR